MYHMDRIFHQMDRLFENAFDETVDGQRPSVCWKPSLDMYELQDRLVLLLELPAVKKKDIDVLLKNDVLIISGIRHTMMPKEEHICHRIEIQQGRFQRSFRLMLPVKADGIVAEFKNGILKIEIPKENDNG